MRVKLTDRKIRSTAPADKPVIIYDSEQSGMCLRVMPSGHRSFLFIARIPPSKHPTRRSLGCYAGAVGDESELSEDDLLALQHLSLAQARAKTALWRRLIQRKLDPEKELQRRLAEKQEQDRRKARNTFESVARQFLDEYVSGTRSARAISALIENKLIAHWRKRPIASIGKRDIVERIMDVKRTSGPASARQTLGYCKTLFSWCLESDIIAANPCPTAIGKRSKLLPPNKPRDRTLTDREIKLLWAATAGDVADVYPWAQFIRLLLILGCRRNELALARHAEFDLTKPGSETWTLKGERTKSGDLRIVPLPALAVQMIRDLPRFDGKDRHFLFSTTHGRRPIANYSKIKRGLDRKIVELNGGAIDPFVLHDLRRTMRTGLSALPISPLVAELMIGHRQQGVLAIYDQHRYADEQRAGYEAWCARLRDIVEPPPDNVVRLAAEARA